MIQSNEQSSIEELLDYMESVTSIIFFALIGAFIIIFSTIPELFKGLLYFSNFDTENILRKKTKY